MTIQLGRMVNISTLKLDHRGLRRGLCLISSSSGAAVQVKYITSANEEDPLLVMSLSVFSLNVDWLINFFVKLY